MRFTNRAGLLSVLFLIGAMPGVAIADESATDAFGSLTQLVGRWEGKFADGRVHSVSYRLTAGGTVLVETWTLGKDRESMTLYHLDGDRLLATHYCPQGNQPRLVLIDDGDPETLSFTFVDGTNLQVPGRSHQHDFWIRRTGETTYQRSETYVDNGGDAAAERAATPDAPVTYTRVDPPAPSR
ncbi:hypothetical protein [Arenimonas oryziterrae]|nr:hypothetical protein [Arenimonas oryziterrae]